MPGQPEVIALTSGGDRLVAHWYVPDGDTPATGWPAVLVVHGAIDYKEHFADLAHALTRQGLAVLVPDMRGHGESGGRRYHVRIREWVEDVAAALDWLSARPDINADRIGAFGFSSGGTAVLEAAAAGLPLRTLVTLDATVRSVLNWLETPAFAIGAWFGRLKERLTGKPFHVSLEWALESVPAAVDEQVRRQIADDPYVRAGYRRFPVPGALEALKVDTLRRVHLVRCPVLILHGEQDQVDPPASARALHDALTCERELVLIPGSGHVGHLDQARDQIRQLTCQWFRNRLSDNQVPVANQV
ncbi:alpha/beta fold hydrolase [Hahella sp. SMD15-11]|uniref:Alpha/beta fold hydrolase n=1 Tax=Thermohahella caldifontis TaxID=3142973 RepID=A0AB39UWJ0_9GAMM